MGSASIIDGIKINDYLLVLIIVGVVQYLKTSWEWITLAEKPVRKNRIKLATGLIAALLSFAMTVLVSTHSVLSLIFWSEWLLRFVVSWIASMGGFDWLKLAAEGMIEPWHSDL